jgi:hypothetical protein
MVSNYPYCGLRGQLARQHWQHRANNLALVMVGRGRAEESRRKAEEHGFEFPVVLQQQWKLSREYGILAVHN